MIASSQAEPLDTSDYLSMSSNNCLPPQTTSLSSPKSSVHIKILKCNHHLIKQTIAGPY